MSASTTPPTAARAHSHHHGHGHSHSHGPDPFLISKDKTDPGVRITRIGLYVNFMMALSKGVGGWYFGSQALVADAFHALTDMVSDVMTLATVSFAVRPPNERNPNGYGKVEALGSLGVSGLLLMGGMAMGYTSLIHLLGDLWPELAGALPHAGHHDHSHAIPSLNAAWLALGSIVVKEWLYRKTMAVAKAKQSSVLASNAVHHRVDSLTAIVALAAIGGANLFPHSAAWLDPVGGMLVAAMVVQAGAGNTMAALGELADMGVSEEVREEVERRIRETGEEVLRVEGVKSGQNFLFKATVRVGDGTTVGELGAVEEKVREAVGKVPGAWRVGVRFVGSEVGEEEVRTGEFVKLDKGGKKDI